MLYNLLIVDDEPEILLGVLSVIGDSTLPIKEIKTCNSSTEALALFKKAPFDVVISDIKMPQMTGISMIEEMLSIWPKTKFVFLTGFPSFEYAHKAIRLGASDYLLKPIRDKDLLSCLEKILAGLDQTLCSLMEKQRMKKEVGDALTEQRSRYLVDSLSRNLTPEQRQKDFDGLSLPFHGKSPLFPFLIRVDDLGFLSADGVAVLRFLLLNVLEEQLAGYQLYGFWNEGARLVILSQSTTVLALSATSLRKKLEEMQSLLYEQMEIKLSIAFASQTSWEGLQRHISHLETALEKESQFMSFLQINTDDEPQKSGQSGATFMIQRVKQYVSQNPDSDLSLTGLSQRLKINASYLSRLFHQEEDQPLSVFITSVRINHAKNLLTKTDLKIYEIAEKSGFLNATYFGRVFQKELGCSPKQYRSEQGWGLEK